MRVSRRGFASVISALLCLCLPAISQDRDRDRGRDNEPHRLVARVQDHLMRAERATRPRGRERDRYENARKHLADFDQSLSRRQFDKGRLDTAIDDVKNVVDGNPLSPDAKDELSRDLAELRELRERFDRGEFRGDFH
jgi:hypothetical protein